jgi:hypothetical protein
MSLLLSTLYSGARIAEVAQQYLEKGRPGIRRRRDDIRSKGAPNMAKRIVDAERLDLHDLITQGFE